MVRLARRALRNLIWRLRNRLIVAYLFIAVVPIVLVIGLLAGAVVPCVGQTAVYLVNTALDARMRQPSFPADVMVRGSRPGSCKRLSIACSFGARRSFPEFELLATGEDEHATRRTPSCNPRRRLGAMQAASS